MNHFNQYQKDIYAKRLGKVDNTYEFMDAYIKTTVTNKRINKWRMIIRHKICNSVIDIAPTKFFNQNRRCATCHLAKLMPTVDDVKRQIFEVDPDYELKSGYINKRTKITLLHKPCGNLFDTIPYNFVGNGNRCPFCFRQTNDSKAVKYLETLLAGANIKFEKEKSFPELKNKLRLRFDFYLPDLNILIEIDGTQHFRYSTDGWNNLAYFEKVKENDDIKNRYAFSNGIELIRVSYKQWRTKIQKLVAMLCDGSSTTIERENFMFSQVEYSRSLEETGVHQNGVRYSLICMETRSSS